MHFGGGGGHCHYILVGCATAHKKESRMHGKGGGVLGTGKTQKREVLRTGLVKKRILVTNVAQNGVLGSLFINFLYFFLVNMINW